MTEPSRGPSGLVATSLRALRLVWAAAPRLFVVVLVLQVVAGVAVTVQLLAGKAVLDGLGPVIDEGAALSTVAPELVVLALATVVVASVGAITQSRNDLLGQEVARLAQRRIVEVAAGEELVAFDDPAFHDQLSRATESAEYRPYQLATGLVTLASGSFALVGLLVGMVFIAPAFIALALLAFVPLWLAGRANSRAVHRAWRELTEVDRERAAVEQLLTGRESAAEVRLLGLQDLLRARFDELYEQRIVVMRRLTRVRERRALIAGTGASAITVGVVGLAVWAASADRLSAADALVTAVAVQQLGSRLATMSGGASRIQETLLFLTDLDAFMERPAERPAAPAPPQVGTLELDDVSFRYPGGAAPALVSAHLTIRPGEVVALVGRNGSGKTTLAKVACGLLAPAGGSVRWDGTDLADIDRSRLGGRFAVAFQDFVAYPFTVHENIAVGDVERLDDRAGSARAAEVAGLSEKVASLPEGFDTRLSTEFAEGTELSGGQWQRVALARALFSDAPVVVLDEPTASLDAHAEHDLFLRVRRLLKGRSALLITHRLATVREADRIYVLDAGRVVEEGTHAELLARGGEYAAMYRKQSSAYAGDIGAPTGDAPTEDGVDAAGRLDEV